MNVLRRLAEIVHDGSLILWERRSRPLIDWTRDGGIVQRIVRTALLALPAWIIIRTVRAHPKLMWPLAAAWCIAAWRAQRGAPRRPVAPAAAEPEPEALDEAFPQVSPEEFLRLVREAIGPHKAVHLVTLVERLAGAHPGRPWDIPSVRDLAAAAGLPVRAVVRAPGRGPTVGIHRDDLPPLPARPSGPPLEPVEDVVVAGQDATTSPATGAPATPATPELGDDGQEFAVEDDPSNPYRALVKWS